METMIVIFFIIFSFDLGFTETCKEIHCNIKPRRYDVRDLGYAEYFRGWVDVQGQGAANDYCRVVGKSNELRLACALAGTHGTNEYAYKSIIPFDKGYSNTWYMKDEDGDGRDDYCRCVGNSNALRVECMKAGEKGFYGSSAQGGSQYTFSPTGFIDCDKRQVRPEFGRPNWDFSKSK